MSKQRPIKKVTEFDLLVEKYLSGEITDDDLANGRFFKNTSHNAPWKGISNAFSYGNKLTQDYIISPATKAASSTYKYYTQLPTWEKVIVWSVVTATCYGVGRAIDKRIAAAKIAKIDAANLVRTASDAAHSAAEAIVDANDMPGEGGGSIDNTASIAAGAAAIARAIQTDTAGENQSSKIKTILKEAQDKIEDLLAAAEIEIEDIEGNLEDAIEAIERGEARKSAIEKLAADRIAKINAETEAKIAEINQADGSALQHFNQHFISYLSNNPKAKEEQIAQIKKDAEEKINKIEEEATQKTNDVERLIVENMEEMETAQMQIEEINTRTAILIQNIEEQATIAVDEIEQDGDYTLGEAILEQSSIIGSPDSEETCLRLISVDTSPAIYDDQYNVEGPFREVASPIDSSTEI